jgi:3-oxoacyl-(acyl-carrier-protein) synthase
METKVENLMKNIGIHSSNVFSPLGCSTATNLNAVLKGESGVKMQDDGDYSAKIHSDILNEMTEKEQITAYTRFEQIAILSVKDALQSSELSLKNSDTYSYSPRQKEISIYLAKKVVTEIKTQTFLPLLKRLQIIFML